MYDLENHMDIDKQTMLLDLYMYHYYNMDLMYNGLLLCHIVDQYNPENSYIDMNLIMVYMYHLNMVHLNMY